MESMVPSFLTHHEVDRILGGGSRGPRRRQRLQAERVLPEPFDLGRVNRVNLKIFPSFALAGLLRDLLDVPGGTDALRAQTQQIFKAESFLYLMDSLKRLTGESSGWRFDKLLAQLAQRAPEPLLAWTDLVGSSEGQLGEWGITIARQLGQIDRVAHGIYVVDFAREARESFDRAASPVRKGQCVSVERVSVRSSALSFVMPTLAVPEPEDATDRELAAWFKKMMTPAVAIPSAILDEDRVDHAEHLPYRRASSPRPARWRGAGTMTRVPHNA